MNVLSEVKLLLQYFIVAAGWGGAGFTYSSYTVWSSGSPDLWLKEDETITMNSTADE